MPLLTLSAATEICESGWYMATVCLAFTLRYCIEGLWDHRLGNKYGLIERIPYAVKVKILAFAV